MRDALLRLGPPAAPRRAASPWRPPTRMPRRLRRCRLSRLPARCSIHALALLGGVVLASPLGGCTDDSRSASGAGCQEDPEGSLRCLTDEALSVCTAGQWRIRVDCAAAGVPCGEGVCADPCADTLRGRACQDHVVYDCSEGKTRLLDDCAAAGGGCDSLTLTCSARPAPTCGAGGARDCPLLRCSGEQTDVQLATIKSPPGTCICSVEAWKGSEACDFLDLCPEEFSFWEPQGCVCRGPSCGQRCCAPGDVCDGLGACCTPRCRECGDDGCGGSCGSCTEDHEACVDGVCQCAPDCEDRQCGPNGCGRSCGMCPGDQFCGADGRCQPD